MKKISLLFLIATIGQINCGEIVKIAEAKAAEAKAKYENLRIACIGLGALSLISHTQFGKNLGHGAVGISKAALTSATTLTTQAASGSSHYLTSYVMPVVKSSAQAGKKALVSATHYLYSGAQEGSKVVASKTVDVTNNYIVPGARLAVNELLNFLTSKDTIEARICFLPIGAFLAYSAIRDKDWKPITSPVGIGSLAIGLSGVAQTDTAQSIVSTAASASVYGLKTAASVASATTTDYIMPVIKNTADVVAPAVTTVTKELVEILKSRDARYSLIPLGAIGAIQISPYISPIVKKSYENFLINVNIKRNIDKNKKVEKALIYLRQKKQQQANLLVKLTNYK